VGGQHNAPVALPPGHFPVLIAQETGWASAGLDVRKISRSLCIDRRILLEVKKWWCVAVSRKILGFKGKEYDAIWKKCNIEFCRPLGTKATETGNNIGRACSARGIESCLRRNFRWKPSKAKSHQAEQLRIIKNTCIRETEFGVD
jgi:hypothetical protein